MTRGEPLDRPTDRSASDETFDAFASKWLEDYVKPNNKYLEQRAKKYILSSSLIPVFGKMLISKIGPHDIERYKAAQIKAGVGSKTLKNRLTVLNKCLVTAYEWLNLAGAPPKIRWPQCASFRTVYLSAAECERLVARADGIIREMILMALRTGMRQGELKGLQWTSIDWENRSVAIRHSLRDVGQVLESPENNRERHIPLDTDVYEMLYLRMRPTGFVFTDEYGRPFNEPRLNRRLTRLCRLAEIRRITWHDLRHTFASQLAMRGVPLHIIQTLLGHSSITTTMRYAHVAPSALRPAIELLSAKRVPSANLGQPAGNEWLEAQFQDAA